MSLSLNEVESTARKAARGAGYPWGLSEEAGKATRWLCAQGLPGCSVLAETLTRLDGVAMESVTPEPGASVWSAQGGTLCPLATGAALSDAAAMLDAPVRFENVIGVPLLLPFAAAVARRRQQPVTLESGALFAVCDGQALSLSELGAAAAPQHAKLSLSGVVDTPLSPVSRATPDADAWETLIRLAHRTYAPATDESRQRGAGADMTE